MKKAIEVLLSRLKEVSNHGLFQDPSKGRETQSLNSAISILEKHDTRRDGEKVNPGDLEPGDCCWVMDSRLGQIELLAVSMGENGEKVFTLHNRVGISNALIDYFDTLFYVSDAKGFGVRKKLRPFKSAEEFEPHARKWVFAKGGNARSGVNCFNDHGIDLACGSKHTYQELLDNFKFSDGTACGVVE